MEGADEHYSSAEILVKQVKGAMLVRPITKGGIIKGPQDGVGANAKKVYTTGRRVRQNKEKRKSLNERRKIAKDGAITYPAEA